MKIALELIREYIETEIRKNQTFLFNELDLQMFVGKSLETKYGSEYNILFEYRLPKGWNNDFDNDYSRWGETPYFDIVMEHKEEKKYIGIELKYKLKELKLNQDSPDSNFTRFGTCPPAGNTIELVSNQAAENEGRYDFWKDVKRLELLKTHFEDYVLGGIAVFLTNQESYTRVTTEFKYSNFCFTQTKEGYLCWNYNNSKPKWCKLDCDCGKNGCVYTPCGEDIKKKYVDIVKNEFDQFERPNFQLNKKYIGRWLNDPNCKKGFKGPLGQNFFCYSVVID